MRQVHSILLVCAVTYGSLGGAAERSAVVFDFESGDLQGRAGCMALLAGHFLVLALEFVTRAAVIETGSHGRSPGIGAVAPDAGRPEASLMGVGVTVRARLVLDPTQQPVRWVRGGCRIHHDAMAAAAVGLPVTSR